MQLLPETSNNLDFRRSLGLTTSIRLKATSCFGAKEGRLLVQGPPMSGLLA